VLCLQSGWCALSHADSFTTNIISGVSTNAGTDFILGDSGSLNYLEINSGGSLGCVYATIGNNPSASNNTALVTGTNSVWTATGGFFVGEESAGNSLIVSNGGQLVSTGLSDLGDGTRASNNVVILTGTNSAWSNNGSLIIGYQGSGNQLLVLNGAQLFGSNFLWLGTEQTANNTLVVDGLHSRVSSSGSFVVGAGGSGNQFTLSGGASFVCAWAQVSGSGNVITISGSNTVWNNQGGLDSGYCCGGSNQLTISAGAVVSNAAVLIGDSIVASNNVVLVTGSNSLWQINGYFYVSSPGNLITITNQARVDSSSLTIDSDAPLSQSRSLLTVADASVWSNSGTLDIGYNGAGNELDIEGGSRIVGNMSIVLGGSNSVVNIGGANSLFSSSGAFTIGQFGGGGHHVTISNGAALVTLGGTSIGPGNIAGSTITLTGIGSVWTNGFQIYMSSPNDSISITDGAYLNSGGLLIGNGASGNSVLVSGPGTRMDAGIDIGYCGYTNNSLVVSNGAVVNGDLGLDCAAQVTLTGTNTIWSDSGTLEVTGNDQASILDSAQFLGNQFVYVSGNGNSIQVAGNGARWGKIGQLYFGQSSASNNLSIGTGGSVDAQQMFIGAGISGLGNLVAVAGALTVTNGGTGQIQLQNGQILLQQGVVMMDLLSISVGAAVTGCGTMIGNINNSGTLAVTCPGGTLTLDGIVTNNASIVATNGADIEFLSSVVNNGTIDLVNGFGHFLGGFLNRGVYRDAGTVLKMPSLDFNGAGMVISFGSVSGKTYAVEYTNTMTPTNWAVLFGGITGTGGTMQFTDTSAVGLTQRFYRVHLALP
jgi:T5SS/PEP-CTERM-associated repeat protein